MNPPPNFNRLAHLYRWMEGCTFGPWLSRARLAFLPQLNGCRRALVLGDGDGRFTARLLRANSGLHVDAVDASPAMLKVLVSNAGQNAARIHTHCCDARLWQSPAENPQYDLIATHFFLDCLTTEEAESLAARLRRIAAPSALWVVSEFAISPSRFGRIVARPLIYGLYWAFGRLTGLALRRLPDHRLALKESGFALQTRRAWLGGLLASELWSISRTGQPEICP